MKITDTSDYDIYWANAMFSVADRSFNSSSVSNLRELGYSVFLPQEADVNDVSRHHSPTSTEIFRTDTTAILQSGLLVACIDHECIDCGVASEVGIAFASGLPIIGLYTDVRQFRAPTSRLYKNPYVIGAIEASGEIVSDIQGLIAAIPRYLSRSGGLAVAHFDSLAPRYPAFIDRLESWYRPRWTIETAMKDLLPSISPKRVLEIGCGPGRLAKHLVSTYPGVRYIGYDQSAGMVRSADSSFIHPDTEYANSWTRIEEIACEEPFDLVVAAFSLHDHPDPLDAISSAASLSRPDGLIFITDLATSDLPALTSVLHKKLAVPLRRLDSRLAPSFLADIENSTNTKIVDCRLALPRVVFPSANDLLEYLEIFGVFKGMDLPLGFKESAEGDNRKIVRDMIRDFSFPFTDQRVFIQCILQAQ